ncbi:hypothetical protein BASA81_004639 [Batrachochytrium salamandrivorans]|nr:hypothetical protein BASA81_004639 [Batrachochytrium salamandrivorans]
MAKKQVSTSSSASVVTTANTEGGSARTTTTTTTTTTKTTASTAASTKTTKTSKTSKSSTSFVLAVNLRIQVNPLNSTLGKVYPERAFAEFAFASIVLLIFSINFVG